MKRGLASIIVLLVLLVLGALLLFKFKVHQDPFARPQSAQSVDPYGDWKVHEDQTDGFSIRYPPDWFTKIYSDSAVDFLDTNPQEATPNAIKVRLRTLRDKADAAEFEKIQKLEPESKIREPLDVVSTVTKIKNLSIGSHQAVEYVIDRSFSALEGPIKEYSHVYEINKEGEILKFQISAENQDQLQQLDPTFTKIISSIKFLET